MTRSRNTAAVAALALALVAAPLLAGKPSPRSAVPPTTHAPAMAPANVVKARQAGYKEMGTALKNVFDSLRANEPQTIMLQQSARTIRSTSQAIYTWFPADSGPQPGLKTSAKPEIWAKPAEFRAAADQLAKAADTFQAAAGSGNMDTIRAAARGLGGACKNCHDQFRVPDRN